MRTSLFTDEHEEFRATIRSYFEREVVPAYPDWLEAKVTPRSFFAAMGELGVIGMAIPVEYGGSGIDDYRYNMIVQQEAARSLITLGTLRTQLDVIQPYFREYANAEQRARWFPGIASGELLVAIAMTEPDTGSDLAGIRSTAARDGDSFVLNGSKTFITGGGLADLIIVLARTSTEENRRDGLTLLVVEDGMPGFGKGRALDKIGLAVQDTVELNFKDVRVPAANVLGDVGAGFGYLGRNLAQERLAIAVGGIAQARAALDVTIGYVKERRAFGTPIASFQNTKFELAAVSTEVEAAQAYLYAGVAELLAGELSAADAARIKLFCTEVQARAVDRCLQLFGGYGYINEYPIARLYADARVTRIYGGTSEVLKTIISKSLGL